MKIANLYMPTRDDVLKLADRLDRGAAELEHTAEHAAEILPTRAGGAAIDPAKWTRQKQQGALVAREAAADLRRAADTPPRLIVEQYAQAEIIASAAELDGILIDGRRLAAHKADSDSYFDQGERQLWEQGEHPTQLKAALIESTGMFGYVSTEIDGRPQVPFWTLGGPRKPDTCTCPCDHDAGCLTCGCVCEDPGPCPCCGAAGTE